MKEKKGVKSLYYCRSKSIARADIVSAKAEVQDHGIGAPPPAANGIGEPLPLAAAPQSGEHDNDYEECLSCQ